MNKFLLLSFIIFSISGCKIMPYQTNFDCEIPKGYKCKSIYEINKMADEGIFDPDNQHKASLVCCNTAKRCRLKEQ